MSASKQSRHFGSRQFYFGTVDIMRVDMSADYTTWVPIADPEIFVGMGGPGPTVTTLL